MEIAFTNGVGRFRLMRERIKNLCAYFLVVFNLIVGAVSVYSTATALTGKTIWVIVIIISVLGLCGSIALIVEKAYKPLSDKVEELSEGYITVAEKFKSESLRIKECFYDSNNPEEFKKEILTGCHYLVSDLKDIINNALGKKVRVCIKMFRSDSDELLFTYCRDSFTIDQSIKKEHNQRIDVNKNSDFSDILNGNKDYFVGSDLKKDYKEKKYHNTNKEFKYSSAVVVPIRALKEEIVDDYDKKYYDNIGFLCVDSKHKHLFSNGHAKMCVNLIQATAHFLYVFISQGNEYYDCIKESITENAEEVVTNG